MEKFSCAYAHSFRDNHHKCMLIVVVFFSVFCCCCCYLIRELIGNFNEFQTEIKTKEKHSNKSGPFH